MTQSDYSGMALTVSIIALLLALCVGGYVYLQDNSPELVLLQSKLDLQSTAISENSNAISQLNSATQVSLNNLDNKIAQVNANRYYGGDYDSEINDLEDVWDCLEDYANGGSKGELEDCLDDI